MSAPCLALAAAVAPSAVAAPVELDDAVEPTTTATGTLVAWLLERPGGQAWATEERFEADPIEAVEDPTIEIGGALRFNFGWNSWAGDSQVVATSRFDTFRFDLDGRYSDLYFSAQYRFYAGYNMLQHGYIGADLADENLQIKAGVTQVPFGILPYAVHNFFFSLKYYVGLEDDYDLGFRVGADLGDVDIHVGFFKNDEGNYSGSSADSARYSYDLVRTRPGDLAGAGIEEARTLKEVNQANSRVALTLEHGEDAATEIGISGQIGQTFDDVNRSRSRHWAVAGHVDGSYGWLDLQLEAGHYDIGQNQSAVPNPELVAMGAYDAPYAVAAEASFVVANAALEIPVDVWLLDSVTVYTDFSTLLKSADGFADSQQLVAGSLIAAGPLYTYVDWAFGRNHPWLGDDYVGALGAGDPNAPWELRFNVNVGWYF